MAQRLAPQSKVSSPSFTLVRVYDMPTGDHIYHLDFYRIMSEKEVWDIRVEEFLEDGIVVVEWPGRFPELLSLPHWEVVFSLEGECRWIKMEKRS
jgi:tRNA threonylcarbamoyladenosine biosynthesis protein TsaE